MRCGRCHSSATRGACWCSCGRVLTAARRSVRCFCWCGCKQVGARRRAARGDRCPGAFDQCKLLRKSCRERVGGAGLLYNGSRCEDSATRARPELASERRRPARRIVEGTVRGVRRRLPVANCQNPRPPRRASRPRRRRRSSTAVQSLAAGAAMRNTTCEEVTRDRSVSVWDH